MTRLPNDFLWGGALAAHQFEGGWNQRGKGPSVVDCMTAGAHGVARRITDSIEENVFLNSGCILTAREKISIGNHTIFGPNVLVYDHDHQIENEKVLENTFVTEAVCIGNNVWIGAGTVILRGSVIEDNCIIAAGSIVKGHIPAGSIYVQKREKTVLSL